jgi:uncharacterized FAD-dependent dehydrogenase
MKKNRIVDIRIPFDRIEDQSFIKSRVAKKAKVPEEKVGEIHLLKKSIDARKKPPVFQLRYQVAGRNKKLSIPSIKTSYIKSGKTKTVHIVGAGPAGYFAALKLLEYGIKPVIIERGKDVQSRRKDLRSIQQFGIVNPNSNYCFGEGGAGTYSDGKLYTRSQKRGKIEHILQLLVDHGAPSDILVDAHPHIGSNKLPKIIQAIRKTIEGFGGEIRFDCSLQNLVLQDGTLKEIELSTGEGEKVDNLILATGHSARDIYYMLQRLNISLEAKDFALGVRIEHPQALIDEIQYDQRPRSTFLPAASYKLVCQVYDRGVFSFCMCPGGLIVPAATAPGEIVVNGMSLSKRDSPYANAGTVTAVSQEDFSEFLDHGNFAGLEFQRSVEQQFFNFGDGSQKAPAQLLTDFIIGKESPNIHNSSYIPGLYSAPVHALLPAQIYERLRLGILRFGQMMPGYLSSEAQVVATESRTSSPLRIPRNKISLMHPDVEGLYPCGEGAGFAGGILSAAMDGQKVAKMIAEKLKG